MGLKNFSTAHSHDVQKLPPLFLPPKDCGFGNTRLMWGTKMLHLAGTVAPTHLKLAGPWNNWGLKEKAFAQSAVVKTTTIQPLGSKTSFHHDFPPLALGCLTWNQGWGLMNLHPLQIQISAEFCSEWESGSEPNLWPLVFVRASLIFSYFFPKFFPLWLLPVPTDQLAPTFFFPKI